MAKLDREFGQGIKKWIPKKADPKLFWSVLTIPMMRQCISLRIELLQWCRR